MKKKTIAKKKTTAKKSSKKTLSKKSTVKKKSTAKKKSTRQNPTGVNRRPTNKEKATGFTKKNIAPPTTKPQTFFTPKKKEKFIELLMEYGVVTYAAQGVDVTRQTAYAARRIDKHFAEAWDEAVEFSVENMERVAYDRAVNGVNEPLSFKGELTGDYIKRYSDILLMFMIKGNKPEKYRENTNTQVNVNVSPNSLSDSQLLRIAQGATIEGESEVVG